MAVEKWRREVPGARWFRADLHIHTIDDAPGGRAKMPSGISGPLEDDETLSQYARAFLRAAIAQDIQVLGLTPHCPRTGSNLSAVWTIVNLWNQGTDDDGVPFREKIFAVFPGFEPNLHHGARGLHLLFLFDPEIGRNCYLRVFDSIMGGRAPWDGDQLRLSRTDTQQAFATIEQVQRDEKASWDFMALAPHFDSEHGLLREMKAQVLGSFPGDMLAGYELPDDKLPDDYPIGGNPGQFLIPFMERHCQAFFHASDAYSLSEIGKRYTWLKLASPSLQSVRQAIVARDSRLRIAFQRVNGTLKPLTEPPDATVAGRPWLRNLTVSGGASFFGGRQDDQPRQVTFSFSPDLTCVIGGSMTGKSTLLDGLRVHVGAAPPQDEGIRKQVLDRANYRFLAGAPTIELDCPGPDPNAPLQTRWPAVFFAQNELQRLSQEASAVEDILSRLVPEETVGIQERTRSLAELDRECARLANQLVSLDEKRDEAEQALTRALQAQQALAVFEEAGIEQLNLIARETRAWEDARARARDALQHMESLARSLDSFEQPGPPDGLVTDLDITQLTSSLASSWNEVRGHTLQAVARLKAWLKEAGTIHEAFSTQLAGAQVRCQQALAAQGYDARRLQEFEVLNRQAALVASYRAGLTESENRVQTTETSLYDKLKQRAQLVQAQRDAFDRVCKTIERDFGGRIQATRDQNAVSEPLEQFLGGLKQRGVTRWWNELSGPARPSPGDLHRALESGELEQLGMSDAVGATFAEVMTRARRRELLAIRCPDRYRLALLLENGTYRPLDELSGGQRVSVLLSLLLETIDPRPLVIDQPEDELDTRFLFETVLPVLKKLKGRRQVILATHSANIVVNGDADLVLQLEATAQQGRVAVCGTIDQTEVRNAIVATVDGGDEAFRLRRLKYGF